MEVVLVQGYMKDSLNKLLRHLVNTLRGVDISIGFNKSEEPPEYLRDLFQLVSRSMENKNFDDNQKEKFLDAHHKPTSNSKKIAQVNHFEECINAKMQGEEEMDKKYYKVDYNNPVKVSKAKKMNPFYKVEECMEEWGDESLGDAGAEDLVVDNLQDISPEDQQAMGKQIAQIVKNDVEMVKQIPFTEEK